ncbi:MAG: type II toxin-antitoxin system RelE/ParE family toxin [Lachnospiraceae bacterium]|jgi:plasmid stabilization system protein ParE|nr:type II toxin-antitoxin system RelE/ParE family toxin [Lachnospiraceae bacterium]
MDLAESDYNEIHEYLAQFQESALAGFIDELEKRTAALEDMPYMFAVYEPLPKYRRIVVREYLVFYKVIEEFRRVEIHRILHGARNIVKVLKGTTL